ncbi:MAG: ATP-binding protein [Ignavibacteria bacterium]|jgi:hypothetical protein|nr:ATP-binding protein [Ignavibacteria bacterium]MCU7519086.1 ATP-binding protein [Ignavibacteria bacterium]
MPLRLETNEKGYIKRRESDDLEFKENFHLGNNLLEYLRSLVGMANNHGGRIIFGIKDKPRIPVGMTNDKFVTCDPAKISALLLEYFSPSLEWEMNTVEFQGKKFGSLSVEEAATKPVVCKKNGDNTLRESAIYYRYRGQTREIQYPELINILAKEREKERLLWMQHIERIARIGPQNINLLDTYNGEILTDNKKILLSEELLSKIKFVKEGHFIEKGGAPTLTLMGEISGLVNTETIFPPDKAYPYSSNDIQEKCKINQYDFQAIIWKYKVKGNPKYHTKIKAGKKSCLHKYTEEFLSRIQNLLKRKPHILKILRKEFRNERRTKKETA